MKHILLFFCLLGPLALVAQHNYYFPNSLSFPTFSGKKSLQIGAGIARSGATDGIEADATWVAPKRFFARAGFMNMGGRGVRQNTAAGNQFRFYDISGGLYQLNHKGSAHLMAGAGYGSAYNCYTPDDSYSNFQMLRVYVQPSLLFEDYVFIGGVSIRMSHLRFLKGGEVVSQIDESELSTIRNIESRGGFFLPEFGLMAGVRFDPIAIKLQITSIFPPTDDYGFARLATTLGLTYCLDK